MKRLLLILALSIHSPVWAFLHNVGCAPAIERAGSAHIENESGVTTFFDRRTGLLQIEKNGRVVARATLRQSFEAFESIAQEVRIGEGFENVAPFMPLSLTRHYESHGTEFAILSSDPNGAEKYQKCALQFVKNESASAISFVFYDSGAEMEKWVKFDVATNELVILNARHGNLITYFKVDAQSKRRMGFSGPLEYVLKFYDR